MEGKTCDTCGSIMVGCFHAEDGFKLKHWLCLVCGAEDRAIGREKMITEEQLNETKRKN